MSWTGQHGKIKISDTVLFSVVVGKESVCILLIETSGRSDLLNIKILSYFQMQLFWLFLVPLHLLWETIQRFFFKMFRTVALPCLVDLVLKRPRNLRDRLWWIVSN